VRYNRSYASVVAGPAPVEHSCLINQRRLPLPLILDEDLKAIAPGLTSALGRSVEPAGNGHVSAEHIPRALPISSDGGALARDNAPDRTHNCPGRRLIQLMTATFLSGYGQMERPLLTRAGYDSSPSNCSTSSITVSPKFALAPM
jgi:hypothetical protein